MEARLVERPALSLRALVTAGAAGLVLFCVLAAAVPDGFGNGDAAVYAEQIARRDFGERTLHIGYYYAAAALTAPGGMSDRALNRVSAFFGAASAVGVGLFALALFGSIPLAWLSGGVWVAHGLFLPNALVAEVYVAQTAFLVIAALLWRMARPFWSGILLGAAVLVAPQSVLALPFFLLLPGPRRGRRPFLELAGTALLLASLVLAPHASEYLTGRRGLLFSGTTPFRPVFALGKEALELLRGFVFLLPFLALGILRLFRVASARALLLALAALWGATWIGAERFGDVPVELPLYALLAPVTAWGLLEFAQRARMRHGPAGVALVLSLPLALTLAASLTQAWWTRARVEGYRREVLSLAADAAPGFGYVGGWEDGILLEHYLVGRSYAGIWIDAKAVPPLASSVHPSPRRLPPAARSEMEEARRLWESALRDGRELWFRGSEPALETFLEERGYAVERRGGMSRARIGSG